MAFCNSGKQRLKIQITSFFYEGKAINIKSGLFTEEFVFRMHFCIQEVKKKRKRKGVFGHPGGAGVGRWAEQPPCRELEMPLSPQQALLEGGRCFQRAPARLSPASGTLCCMHYAKLYTGVAGAFLCELRALPSPSEALFDEHGWSSAAPSLFGRCGVTWGWGCLPGSLCEMQVVPVTWLLYISQGSRLLKCFLWLGTGCQFKQHLCKWEYGEVHMRWYRSLALHPTLPIASPLPLQTPPSSWVGQRGQLSSQPVRTSYLKQRLEWLISHNFCLLATI